MAEVVRMSLRDLFREPRTIDGLSVSAGALLTVLVYLWLHDFDLSQPSQACSSVPYSVGQRPSCVTVAAGEGR